MPGHKEATLGENTEDFYRHLVENSLGLICCHDFEGMLLMVNEAAAKALGYTQDELIGRSLADLMPGELRHKFAKYLHRVTTLGQAHGYLTLLDKAGQSVTWIYRNTVYGSSRMVIGHAQDITWRLNIERSLRERNEQFRALFEDAPVAYHEVDQHGMIARVNAAECELLGREKSELIGLPVWELFVPEHRELSKREVKLKLSGDLVPSQVFREYTGNGRRLCISIHDKLIRSRSGAIEGIRSTLLDVTEQRRVETELRELNSDLDRRVSERTAELNLSNERMKEFVYTVSHDLQEPLRAVMGFGGLLRERYRGVLDADGIEFLDYMTNGASRMSGLISNLLAYSRVLHDHSMGFEPTPLDDVLRLAKENLSSAIHSSGAVITQDPLPVVNANFIRLIQLAQNLLSNAIKYRSSDPPRIHVCADRRDNKWVVSVRDNGIGIQESDRERVFHLFKRTADSRAHGSGVGLAICRAIVHQHGGVIWVEPAQGGGSRFCFSLSDNPAENGNHVPSTVSPT